MSLILKANCEVREHNTYLNWKQYVLHMADTVKASNCCYVA